jgi:LPS sulfotransferase NodH
MGGLFHRWRHPPRSYVICGIARSGTNLLSDGLRESGRAGRPNQFFFPAFEEYFRREHGLGPEIAFADYVQKMITRTSTSNGVFGFKLMASYLEDFLARLRATRAFGDTQTPDLDLLRNAFPRLRFLQITRRNKLRQAISQARALQTGVWKVQPGRKSSGMAQFDRELITRCLADAQQAEKIWSAFFGRVALQPLQIEYEELCQNYEATIRAVLKFLRIRLPRGRRIVPITVRQSDAISTEWEELFLASSQGLSDRA